MTTRWCVGIFKIVFYGLRIICFSTKYSPRVSLFLIIIIITIYLFLIENVYLWDFSCGWRPFVEWWVCLVFGLVIGMLVPCQTTRWCMLSSCSASAFQFRSDSPYSDFAWKKKSQDIHKSPKNTVKEHCKSIPGIINTEINLYTQVENRTTKGFYFFFTKKHLAKSF